MVSARGASVAIAVLFVSGIVPEQALIGSAMNSFFSFFILLINYGVGKAAVGSSIASWRAINRRSSGWSCIPLICAVFLGALSLVWGIILWCTLSTPVNARWLTPEVSLDSGRVG
jgi:hypothetical protein